MCVAIALCGLCVRGRPVRLDARLLRRVVRRPSWCSPRSRCSRPCSASSARTSTGSACCRSRKKVKAEGTGFWYRWGHEVAPAGVVVPGRQPHRPAAARGAGAEHAPRLHHRRRRAERHDPARGLRPREPRASAPVQNGPLLVTRVAAGRRRRRTRPPNIARRREAARRDQGDEGRRVGHAAAAELGGRRGGRAGDPGVGAQRAGDRRRSSARCATTSSRPRRRARRSRVRSTSAA